MCFLCFEFSGENSEMEKIWDEKLIPNWNGRYRKRRQLQFWGFRVQLKWWELKLKKKREANKNQQQ